MERQQLRLAVFEGDQLFLYAVSKGLSWTVNIEMADIEVVLNPKCKEGTWVEVTMSTTFGLVPRYVKKVVIYTSTYEAREKWRKAILSSRKESYTTSGVIPNEGPAKPYQPRPLIFEPDPAIKG